MLKSATIKNFGPLPSGEYKFAPGLNVVVGENGSGKSQLLKLLYALLKLQADSKELNKTTLQKECADKLVGVFRADALGRLVTRRQGHDRCEVALSMQEQKQDLAISLSTRSSSSVQIDVLPTGGLSCRRSIYRPASCSPCALVRTAVRQPPCTLRGKLARHGFAVGQAGAERQARGGGRRPAATAGRGDGRQGRGGYAQRAFLPAGTRRGKMEMPLVAEGLRKVAMLARLIATGTLLEQGYLFWDEPETNLNPKLIRVIARCIMLLCQQGIQVFVATHSLFLLRELEMLSENAEFRKVKQRFFALAANAEGIQLEQGDAVDDLQTLVLLDEELRQSDRFMGLEG